MSKHPIEAALASAQTEGLEANLARWWRFAGAPPVVELQALKVRGERGSYLASYFAHALSVKESVQLAAKADAWTCPAVYLIANEIDGAVATRAPTGEWHKADKGEATSDAEIAACRALFIDIDARRAKGTSATDEEMGHTIGAAVAIYEQLVTIIGAGAIGLGHSGNGRALLLALDRLAPADVKPRHQAILAALAARHTNEHVEIDRSVHDAKRLIPCWGTTKRKGAAKVPTRPHRRTAFVCGAHVARLALADLDRIVAELRAGLPDEVQREIDKTLGVKPTKAAKPAKRQTADRDVFALAKDVPIADVLSWLGLGDAEQPVCPGCGLSDAGVAVVENGLKCSHARCAAKGYSAGFRTPIDVVSEAKELSPIEAVRLMGARFGFEVPGRDHTDDDSDEAPPPPAPDRVDNRPAIPVVESELPRMTDASVRVLRADPNVFVRAAALSHVVHDVALDDVSRPRGAAVILPLNAAAIQERLALGAAWVRFDGRKEQWRATKVPKDVVSAVMARGEWPGVRSLVGVMTLPIVRPDGSICQTPGYDSVTGYLYEPSCVFPDVALEPSPADVRAAVETLREVIADFPLKNEAHVSAWIAYVLSMVARPAIDGCVPLFAVDKNVRGAGGSLLVDAATVIATGHEASRTALPEDEAEWRKRVSTILLAGDLAVLVDNITAPLSSAALDAMITSRTWRDRRLGTLETLTVAARAVWSATGNGLQIEGDTVRRALVLRLESADENPEDRAGFRHHPLLPWVRASRPRLVHAALTILRAHAVAGRPRHGVRLWGSFETWSMTIAAACVHAGLADPQGCRLAPEEDTRRLALLGLLEGLHRLAPQGMTVRTLVELLYPGERLRGNAPPDGHENLRESIEALVPTQAGKAPSPARLGYVLRHHRRRVVGSLYLDAVTAHGGAQAWCVRRRGDDGDDGDDVQPYAYEVAETDPLSTRGGSDQKSASFVARNGTCSTSSPSSPQAELTFSDDADERDALERWS